MAEFILSDALWNNVILAAILGGIAGVVGFGLGSAASKKNGVNSLRRWTVLACVAVSLKVPDVIRPYFAKEYGAESEANSIEDVMQQVENLRLFPVLFEHHPEARDRFAEASRGIVFDDNIGEDEKRRLIQQASADISNEYYDHYLPLAPDELLYGQIDHNLEVLLQCRDMRGQLLAENWAAQARWG